MQGNEHTHFWYKVRKNGLEKDCLQSLWIVPNKPFFVYEGGPNIERQLSTTLHALHSLDMTLKNIWGMQKPLTPTVMSNDQGNPTPCPA